MTGAAAEQAGRRDEEAIARPQGTRIWDIAPTRGWSLALHGGAGGRIAELADEDRQRFEAGLAAAYAAGSAVLGAGGPALDAVCAAVEQLEDDPLFNAGRGAALTAEGEAQLDASVMDGATGLAGAVAASRHARNPVLLARAVMERSAHLFIVDPSEDLVAGWGLETAAQEYFITEARQQQLARILADRLVAPRHGTVGAVARDTSGTVAAATSTGGMSAQEDGRVGDSPVIGAGTYARNGQAAVSCTGEGEAFIRGVVSHDIVARMRYGGASLPDAVRATIDEELTARHASGGLVSVDADGRVVVAHNSPTMFAAFHDGDRLVLRT
ncbi:MULTISPECIES: isoaspartyl peptidase/L-asparaginase family protein [unclassified Curtobacterium]|uniref:isoaspartyl peptidase/L-asparaginase family protein n=1 Tax=unclassified Curtobacterium TaxID=257496 RepID=UPI000DA6DF86|nr:MULTISPECIES: isoaspartyl peptidase/L-asparaginase [unclassified Curtobacterium]PZE24158.1 isoaspartyl dipeptidase with L-asparaginase activity [Curtobacterium sp. MCBD17_028]PZE71553.1 isoaspartyl dipeptidase with L-asparaginase activity [Curtobacterium sp. MCBD17_019]WIE54507.1 isoaspartyl peptidase/L-asparaginase [Curtobacterium sp. MCBD17_003]